MMICLQRISSSCSDGAHHGNDSGAAEAKGEEESNEVIPGTLARMRGQMPVIEQHTLSGIIQINFCDFIPVVVQY